MVVVAAVVVAITMTMTATLTRHLTTQDRPAPQPVKRPLLRTVRTRTPSVSALYVVIQPLLFQVLFTNSNQDGGYQNYLALWYQSLVHQQQGGGGAPAGGAPPSGM